MGIDGASLLAGPPISSSHGDDPSDFAQTHREYDEPNRMPSGDPDSRAKSAVPTDDQIRADGVEQTLGHKKRNAHPNESLNRTGCHGQRTLVQLRHDDTEQDQIDGAGTGPDKGARALYQLHLAG